MRIRRSSSAVALALALAGAVGGRGTIREARADAARTPEASVDDARALFTEGKNELAAGHAEAALALLARSHAVVPSPNTELLMGRALLALGRRVEATLTLERAEQEAARRVAAGDSRYAPTVTAAHDEASALRSRLGTVVIHLADTRDAHVRVDGEELPLGEAGDAFVLHEPGPVEIVVRRGDVEQRQIATAHAGGTLRIDFEGTRPSISEDTAAAPAATNAAPPPSRRPWAVPLAIASGATAVAGGVMFTAFGVASQTTYDDLAARCGPRGCGAADRADADRGIREQTIANVGLAVAAVGVVSFLTFLVLAPSSSSGTRAVDVRAGSTL